VWPTACVADFKLDFEREANEFGLPKADDYYSLGLTIWKIFTGKVPFQGVKEDQVEEGITQGKSVDLSKVLDHDVWKIISKYLSIGRQLIQSTCH
jgi:serine/threonine protein kinase